MPPTEYGPISWERMINAVEKVRARLDRAVAALEAAGIPYAVVEGNAVAAWVSRVDESAVRNTRDVDILLRRSDLETAKTALEAAGFVYRHMKSIDLFLDGPGSKAGDAVHIVFAGENVTSNSVTVSPAIDEIDADGPFVVANLEALVRMKLSSYLRKDQVHLLDMIDVGLIDATWPARVQTELGARLQALLDDPDG